MVDIVSRTQCPDLENAGESRQVPRQIFLVLEHSVAHSTVRCLFPAVPARHLDRELYNFGNGDFSYPVHDYFLPGSCSRGTNYYRGPTERREDR